MVRLSQDSQIQTFRGSAPVRVRSRIRQFLHVLVERRAYTNLFYLLLTFPLGLFYFIFLSVLLSVGIGTAVLGVGLAILGLAVLAWWGFAAFERYLVMWWIDIEIPPMYDRSLRYPSFQASMWAHLRNPTTWKSFAYLLIEMPFGVFAFAVLTVLLGLSFNLLSAPVLYLVNTVLYNSGYNSSALRVGFPIPANGTIEPFPLLLFLVCSVAGLLLLAGTFHFAKGVAIIWGLFARIMLGMDDSAQRAAQAQAVAVQAQAVAVQERAKAERADQSRRELIVNVSHELRTPIASIRGHVESLLMPEDERPADTDIHKYLEIVAQESERLSVLVDDLLALARADANELRLAIRPVAVNEVIEEVYQSLALLARRDRQVTLVHQVSADAPLVLADRDRLAQVLLNLTRNAITYTPAGGIVSIETLQGDATHLTIALSDTGIGIPPEDLQHIFERFYRTDTSRARTTGGSGLGLSIVRDLVEAMGGTVYAESMVGQGSRFSVTLRIAPLALDQSSTS